MISVIIPAFNEAKNIARCLDSLSRQEGKRSECEIIVVDDGSTDATREIARGRRVRLLEQANAGAAAARNRGAQSAQGEIVLFIDADCEASPNWICAMTAPFSESIVVGVGGMKQTRQRNFVPQFIQMEFDFRYDQVGAHRYIDFIDSGTAAYRRDVFLDNNGFDTTLMDAEDVELSFRLSEQGAKMAFARDAIVYCDHPRSVVEYLRRKFAYAYWRSFVYRRFPKKIASDSRTPQTQKVQTGLALLLLPSIAVAVLWNTFGVVPIFMALVLIATTLPFVSRYWRRDWKIALAGAVLVPLAAFAVGLGVALGAASPQRLGRQADRTS